MPSLCIFFGGMSCHHPFSVSTAAEMSDSTIQLNKTDERREVNDRWPRFDHGEDEFFNKFFSRRQLGGLSLQKFMKCSKNNITKASHQATAGVALTKLA